MKIIVFAPTQVEITPNSINEKPLGGADQQLIRFYEITKSLGHQVKMYVNTKVRTKEWRPYMDAFNEKSTCDVLILFRKAWVLPNTIKRKHTLFYSQDSTDTACFSGVLEKYKPFFKQFKKIIVCSKYHQQDLQTRFNLKSNQFFILGNSSEKIEAIPRKKDKTFIYISTPYRGLQVLAKIWKDHYKEFPNYTLKIFSSMSIYGDKKADETTFKVAYEKIRSLPRTEYNSAVPRKTLLKQLKKARLLLYPNTYHEMYCNAVNDSIACHTPYISTYLGALKEFPTLSGELINGNPYTPSYQKVFVQTIKEALKTKYIFKPRLNSHYATDLTQLLEGLK